MGFLRKLSLFAILILAAFLRLYKLDQVPPGLFGDEVDTGYQAYSILKTGKDYFGNPWPIHFQSLGDWRMPAYIYVDTLFVGLLGLNEIAVRLPAALGGILAVWACYLLTKKLFGPERAALFSAFLLTISPWHLQMSRAAFEAVWLTFLFPLGLYFLLLAFENKKTLFYFLSALFLSLSVYTYNTPKLYLPIFLLVVFFVYRKNFWPIRRGIFIFGISIFLLTLPMVKEVVIGHGMKRFVSLSIFTNAEVSENVRFLRQSCQDSNSILAKILHNKLTVWTEIFIDNYLSACSNNFLFLSGDPNHRHNLVNRGQLYLFEFPFLFLGLFLFLEKMTRNKKKAFGLIFLFLVVAPVPAALTRDGGNHAVRLLTFLPFLYLPVGYALASLKGAIKLLTCLVVFLSLFNYLHQYYFHFPKDAGRWWNYGHKELFTYIKQNDGFFEKIYYSPGWELPLPFVLFYSQYPPDLAQKEMSVSPWRLGKFIFANSPSNEAKTMFVATPGMEINLTKNFSLAKTISDVAGNEVFKVYEFK
jgi:4-amino-4-deoxy-L-arabinose transferase-like glycosyltransferase